MIQHKRKEDWSIAFTGGGTAGHVIPGIAVADSLPIAYRERTIWIGSSSGMERKLVEEKGYPFFAIPSGKLRRYFSFKNFLDIFTIVFGVIAALVVLKRKRARVLFSKGGYVSVPPVLAARILGIPVATHESDSDPGLATRINARFADTILLSLERTRDFFPKALRKKTVITGNPIRKELFLGDREAARASLGADEKTAVVLVLGGSLGSGQINGLVLHTLHRLPSNGILIHQRGKWEVDNSGIHPGARGGPEEGGLEREGGPGYLSYDFIGEELPDYFAAADIVVSRAGANTLWEIGALGKASILIPLGTAGSRGDQIRNAEVFREEGAAIVLEGEEATEEAFINALIDLIENKEKRISMGESAKSITDEKAAERIADIIIKMLNSKMEE